VAAIPELDQDSAYISSGTWSLVGVEMDTCVVSDQARDLNVTNEAGAAGTVRLLKNVTGMWLVQECRRQWRREGHALDWEELLSLARRADPLRSVLDPDAAEFVSPQDMPRAIQAYCRQAGEPVPESVGQVVRCCLESLALKYRYVVQALENLVDHRLKTIRIVGGGSQNSLLCQFTADACERPVVARPAEATALGNGMIQAIARGYLSGISTGREAVAASVERQYYRPQARDAWDEAFARLQDLMGRQSPAESA
jgi:rhamnulokinase